MCAFSAKRSPAVAREERSLFAGARHALGELFQWEDPSPLVVRQWNGLTRGVLLLGAVFAVSVVLRMWHLYLTTDGYVDYVEGLVLFHQSQASAGENVYAPRFRAAPPYSIPLYGPVWYYAIGATFGGEPSLFPGRMAAMVCMLALCAIAWVVLARRFGANWTICAACSVVWLTIVGTLTFGINNRVDALACLLGVSAMVLSALRLQHMWVGVVLLLLAAGFTKPTAVAAPAVTLFLAHLWDRRTAEALWIAGASAAGAAVVLLAGDLLSGGNFSKCLIFSNANPMRPAQGLMLLEHVCKQLVLPVGVLVGAVLLRDRQTRRFGLYAVVAFVFAAVSAAKIGSNTNYFIEPSWAAAVCIGVGLARMQAHVRSALAYGLACFLVIQSAVRAEPYVNETREKLAEWPAIKQSVARHAAEGPILTMEIGALVQSGHVPYVADPHIIARLTEAGAFNDRPILSDLADRKLAAVIVGEDIAPDHVGHTNWTRDVQGTVARFYQPDVDLGRVTVYLPRKTPLSEGRVQSGTSSDGERIAKRTVPRRQRGQEDTSHVSNK